LIISTAGAKISFSYWGGRAKLLRGTFGISSVSLKQIVGSHLKLWEGSYPGQDIWWAGVELFLHWGEAIIIWGNELISVPSLKLLMLCAPVPDGSTPMIYNNHVSWIPRIILEISLNIFNIKTKINWNNIYPHETIKWSVCFHILA